MTDGNFGGLNGHAIGTIIKSAMMRAIQRIRSGQIDPVGTRKENRHKPDKEDFVSPSDVAAQDVYVKLFRESFPEFGIVAEESELSVPCTHPTLDIWLTVDPLDGTKAFLRGQSQGIATMVSLVCDGEVIAAYVGDVKTKELYGYRPGSDSVYRIYTDNEWDPDRKQEAATRLRIDPDRPLTKQYILLRDEPWKYDRNLVAALAGDPRAQEAALVSPERVPLKFFAGMRVDGGSIGMGMSRLWNGEVGAMVLHPTHHTPWDLCPVLGISRKLGFRFLCCERGLWKEAVTGVWTETPLSPSKQVVTTADEILVVHESRLEELEIWMANFRR